MVDKEEIDLFIKECEVFKTDFALSDNDYKAISESLAYMSWKMNKSIKELRKNSLGFIESVIKRFH